MEAMTCTTILTKEPHASGCEARRRRADRARRSRSLRRAWREGFGTALLLLIGLATWGTTPLLGQADDSKPVGGATSTSTEAVPSTSPPNATVGVEATTAAPPVEVEAANESSADKNAPRILSVAPEIDRPTFRIDRERRPTWVDSPPVRVGDVHSTAVSSGFHATPQEALRQLDVELAKAVSDYVEEHLGSPTAAELLRFPLRDIKARLRSDQQFVEVGDFDIGPMHQAHALVEFDASFRADLEQRWEQIVSLSRLATFGVGLGAIVLVLGVAFTYLRVDASTRGYYTRRLQLVTLAAILSIVTAGVVLAKHFFLI